MNTYPPVTALKALSDQQTLPVEFCAAKEPIWSAVGSRFDAQGENEAPLEDLLEDLFEKAVEHEDEVELEEQAPSQQRAAEQVPDDYYDDFQEDLSDPQCVQRIYDFTLTQVRGMVQYNDEDDIIQEVFYRLHKWPIGNKYNSAKHYFSLLKITIRQAIAAYWKRRHSQRNDARKRVFISQLQLDGQRSPQFASESTEVWRSLHLKDLVRRVMEKASTLSDQQRTMFQLRFLEQKSHEEVAQVLGVSIRTSYRIETRIRENLQRFFPEVDLDGLIS